MLGNFFPIPYLPRVLFLEMAQDKAKSIPSGDHLTFEESKYEYPTRIWGLAPSPMLSSGFTVHQHSSTHAPKEDATCESHVLSDSSYKHTCILQFTTIFNIPLRAGVAWTYFVVRDLRRMGRELRHDKVDVSIRVSRVLLSLHMATREQQNLCKPHVMARRPGGTHDS